MKCSKCGFDNIENSVYCENCGNYLLSDTPDPSTVGSSSAISKKSKKTKRWIFVLLITLLAAAILGGAIFLLVNNNAESDISNSLTNDPYYLKSRKTTTYYDSDDDSKGEIWQIDQYDFNKQGMTVQRQTVFPSTDESGYKKYNYDKNGKIVSMRSDGTSIDKERMDYDYTTKDGQQIGIGESSDGTYTFEQIYDSNNNHIKEIHYTDGELSLYTILDTYGRWIEEYSKDDGYTRYTQFNDEEKEESVRTISDNSDGSQSVTEYFCKHLPGEYVNMTNTGIICEEKTYTDGQLVSASVITEDTRSDPNGHLKYEVRDANEDLIEYVILTYQDGIPFTWEKFEADGTLLAQRKYDENQHILEERYYQYGDLYSETVYEWALRIS